MLRLKDRSLVPPGGFRYTQPESGRLITASSLPNLFVAVKEHRAANHYPIGPTFETEVEDGVCRAVPDSCTEVPASKTAKVMGLADVLRLTALLGESLIRGRNPVEQSEAERRASICVGCADNQVPEGCAPCQSNRIESAIIAITGARATSRDALLQSCRHCGCFNRAQVWIPLDLLLRHSDPSIQPNLPSHCWKKETQP